MSYSLAMPDALCFEATTTNANPMPARFEPLPGEAMRIDVRGVSAQCTRTPGDAERVFAVAPEAKLGYHPASKAGGRLGSEGTALVEPIIP